MERIGIRELRNDTSRVVKRARAGERIIVTIDGVPAAELGPLNRLPDRPTMEELIASGRVRPPLVKPEPGMGRPIASDRDGPTSLELILEDRGDD